MVASDKRAWSWTKNELLDIATARGGYEGFYIRELSIKVLGLLGFCSDPQVRDALLRLARLSLAGDLTEGSGAHVAQPQCSCRRPAGLAMLMALVQVMIASRDPRGLVLAREVVARFKGHEIATRILRLLEQYGDQGNL
jgi:hypothetical protein